MGVKMIGRIRSITLGIFLNVIIGIIFIIAAVIVVVSVNNSMRRQALNEAQSKARIILDRNLATHTYFSQIMKPSIFEWSKPFRSKDYFDHTWMSSTYAIREIDKYFKTFNPSGYYFKDAAINARSPENEADEYERAFIEKLGTEKNLDSASMVRKIDGKPFLVVLRKGEVMEASCLRCHSNPNDAPKGLTDYYGSERSFNRKAGDVVSAVSLRIPLSEAYAAANIYSLKLSSILLSVLLCLFTIQYWFYRRYLLRPLNVIQEKAYQIATHDEHLGEQIIQPFGKELNDLAAAFNDMSVKLRFDRDHLEELVDKRTDELLREKEFAESLIQTAQTIVLVSDTKGHIVSINPYMENISGYQLKEVQGKDWFSTFVPERDQKRTRELFLKAIADIQTHGNVNPIVTKDGREIAIEWYDKTLKDKSGNITGLLSIGQDITERKNAEVKLINESHMRAALLDNIPGCIALILRKGTREIVASNNYAREIGAVPGQTCFSTCAKRNDHCPFCLGPELWETGQFQKLEVEYRGTWYEGIWAPLSEDLYVHYIFDITERKRMEVELLKADKLESVGILAGGIAHDFNNILTSISGNISMAKMLVKPGDKISYLLSAAETSSIRAQGLTRQLLTFAKGGMPIKEIASIQKLIMESSLFVVQGSKSRCELQIAEDLWPVEADQGQISQVISNIVINANQAMPEGGTIRITAENLMPENITEIPVEPGKYIRISINDQGVGIAEKHLLKIFDPYFTTKQAGSGLGLATSYSIIKKHNGYISVNSIPGAGTTFHIYLPASDKEVPVKEDAVLLTGRGSILMMDDDELLKELAKEMLDMLGYESAFAKNGDEAIEMYKLAMKSGKPYDAVILDLTIPGSMGGQEVIKILLNMNPEIKAVVCSGYSDDEVMSNFRKYGFKGMMPKPFDSYALGKVLNNVLKDKKSETQG